MCSAIDGDEADALLAADVGTVGARVGEALLAIGALVGFLTCNNIDSLMEQIKRQCC